MSVNAAPESTKHVIDGLSIVTVVGTLADVLPAIAALFTVIWTAIRIYETETVKGWVSKLRKDDK